MQLLTPLAGELSSCSSMVHPRRSAVDWLRSWDTNGDGVLQREEVYAHIETFGISAGSKQWVDGDCPASGQHASGPRSDSPSWQMNADTPSSSPNNRRRGFREGVCPLTTPMPSPKPTEPTPEPSPGPTTEPTLKPTLEQTPEPTPEPTREPTPEPTPELFTAVTAQLGELAAAEAERDAATGASLAHVVSGATHLILDVFHDSRDDANAVFIATRADLPSQSSVGDRRKRVDAVRAVEASFGAAASPAADAVARCDAYVRVDALRTKDSFFEAKFWRGEIVRTRGGAAA